MPGSGTGTFIDPDDYQASLRQARIELVVTSRGSFNARLTWVTFHHLQLLHSEEDLPRIAYVSLAPELVFVGFATRPDPPMLWGGVELQTGDLLFHSRAERFHQRTTGACGWSLLGLAPEHLEAYGGAVNGKPLSLPAAMRILHPTARDAARLRRLHAQACRLAETRAKVLAHPEVARAIEQGLIHALVTCLAAKTRDDGAARRHHARIMVRFEEVLADHSNRPLPMSELCALIGVNDRTLRSCCAEFLGISPSRYVLLRRYRRCGSRCGMLTRLRRASRKSLVAAASPNWGVLPGPIGPRSVSRLRPLSDVHPDQEFSTQKLPDLHSQPKYQGSRLATGYGSPSQHEPVTGDRAMNINLTAAARIIPLTALMLGACVSQSAYEKQGAELQQARTQAATEQSQIAKMQQEQKWVVAGDMLFPEAGYQLSANGKQALNQYVPQLQGLRNAKVVVYGYTDNLQVGPSLQRAGIAKSYRRILVMA